MDRLTRRSIVTLLSVALLAAACRHPAPPPRRFTLSGQILAVLPDRQSLTINHGDIPDFMPAMTMTYPVATKTLMEGRTPGELVTATLEVTDTSSQLVAITHTGSAPLPEGTNAVALAAGILAEGDEIPDAALIDQDNHRRSLSDWRGSIMLVTFIYTSCPLPDFCPLMDQNFAALQQALEHDAALKTRVKLVSISFDPAVDTPAVLAAHAKMRHANPAVWTFLTGDPKTIDRLTGRFGVSVAREGTPASISHTLRTTLVDAEGRVRKIYSGNDWTPDAVLADIRAAAARP
jgi:protein SCO1/2